MIKEEWKTIPGVPKYEVSSYGKIRNAKTKNLLKFSEIRRGYKIFKAYREEGPPRNMTVHKAVATTFIPNPDNLPQLNHKNGDKSDNRIRNLEWCTCKQNIRHAFKEGLRKETYTIKHRAKITEKMARRIKMGLEMDIRQNELVNIYNVSKSTVEGIRNGSRWGHIKLIEV